MLTSAPNEYSFEYSLGALMLTSASPPQEAANQTSSRLSAYHEAPNWWYWHYPASKITQSLTGAAQSLQAVLDEVPIPQIIDLPALSAGSRPHMQICRPCVFWSCYHVNDSSPQGLLGHDSSRLWNLLLNKFCGCQTGACCKVNIKKREYTSYIPFFL